MTKATQLSTIVDDLANSSDITKGAAKIGWKGVNLGTISDQVTSSAYGTATDTGTLTGSEIFSLSKGTGFLSTTLTKMASFLVSTYKGITNLPTGSIARNLQNLFQERLSLLDQTVDPTGATTSDQGFINLNTYLNSVARTNLTSANGNKVGNKTIKIPPGTYLLTQTSSFLDGSLWTTRTIGVAIEGDGPPGSVIIMYQPTVSGPMFNNPDKLQNVTFRNLVFFGYDANSDFCASASYGGAQNYKFIDCIFGGTWKYGINLTSPNAGANTNSEMKFERCNFTGTWLSFLFSPALGSGGSDQFLNYWFHNCQVSGPSPFIDMSSGGAIRMTDCDVSGWQGQVSQTYLINLKGTAKARGVCSFIWKGGRMEQKTIYAGVIYSNWPSGIIDFDGVDFSSQAGIVGANTILSAAFDIINVRGPHITFRQCNLMGQHQYTYSSNNYLTRPNIRYEHCTILNAHKHSDFLLLPGATNTGGSIPIEFDQCSFGGGGVGDATDVYSVNCTTTGAFTPGETVTFTTSGVTATFLCSNYAKTNILVRILTGTMATGADNITGATSGASAVVTSASAYTWDIETSDVTYNWKNSAQGFGKSRFISLKSGNSRTPTSGGFIIKCIPMGSVITRLRLFTNGQTFTGAWNLSLHNVSNTASISTSGTNLSTTGGFYVDTAMFVPVSTDSDRTIIYQDLQNWTQSLSNVYALVDYI